MPRTRDNPAASKAGRPRTPPALRYPDEVSIWEATMRNGSFRTIRPTVGEAIHLLQRLNQLRAQLRNEQANGYVAMDAWIVRRTDCVVEIVPRARLDLSDATDINGNPITVRSPDDIVGSDEGVEIKKPAIYIDRNEASPPPDMSRPLIDRD